MPKVRSRKTNEADWTTDHLDKVVKFIDEYDYSISREDHDYSICQSSQEVQKNTIRAPSLGRNTVFAPLEMEKKFTSIIKKWRTYSTGALQTKLKERHLNTLKP